MALKDKLRELLQEKDMRPADLARESGVSEAMLSYYLSGKRQPMGKTCFKLATALGVSVDELLETPFAEKEKPAPQEDGLSEKQQAVIEKLKSLNPDNLSLADDFLDVLTRQQNGQK